MKGVRAMENIKYKFIEKLIKTHSIKLSSRPDKVYFDCAWKYNCMECKYMMECEHIFEEKLPYLDLEQVERMKKKHPELFI